MHQDVSYSQPAELTAEFGGPQVSYDSELVMLTGSYRDELSAYRAKKIWQRTLQDSFLLEPKQDFVARVQVDASGFTLSCSFISSCGRYAFWRLTNGQAIEAQYIIETAHIPTGEAHLEQLISAAEMRELDPEPLLTHDFPPRPTSGSFIRRIRKMLHLFSVL